MLVSSALGAVTTVAFMEPISAMLQPAFSLKPINLSSAHPEASSLSYSDNTATKVVSTEE